MYRVIAALLLFLVWLPSAAQAAICTVEIGDIDFGAVDTIGNTPATSSSEVTIDCDGAAPETTTVTVCGNIGAGSGGTAGGLRQITGPGDTLDFAFYTTGAGSTAWGSADAPELGEPRTISVPVNGGSGSLTVQLHGVVHAGQSTAPVGAYASSFAGSDAGFTYDEGALDCTGPLGGSTTASFSVLASVDANCLLETSDLDFGTAGLIGSNIDAEASMTIVCTEGTDYTISIDGGGSGDPDNRRLVSGGNSVSYDLYSNPQRSARWGTAPGSTVSGDGDGTAQPYGVYGRIPPQPAAAGAYADTVVVTVTY
jgi:spore coat protein U-like protein